jgi:hypothetical protein
MKTKTSLNKIEKYAGDSSLRQAFAGLGLASFGMTCESRGMGEEAASRGDEIHHIS